MLNKLIALKTSIPTTLYLELFEISTINYELLTTVSYPDSTQQKFNDLNDPNTRFEFLLDEIFSPLWFLIKKLDHNSGLHAKIREKSLVIESEGFFDL